MKFFHVYNDVYLEGLQKNGFLNKDSGFKIQNVFSVPKHLTFNHYAAVGTKLYNMIKEHHIPFYVDRIAGGITYYPYTFDRALIREYRNILGDDFLGFQLHESASNRRYAEWPRMMRVTGKKGNFDPAELRRLLPAKNKFTPDGEQLVSLSQDTPEYYATRTYAETVLDFVEEIRDMFRRRLADTDNNILPVDSYMLFTKLQDEMGMRTFMPEIGSQIPLTRVAVALARGMAKASSKKWGTYYECWRADWIPEKKAYTCNMPCYAPDPDNEWYLTQETHGDDFTTHGANGGSSRLLQERIYYHSLMSGADYFGEEWGLCCSYYDTKDFALTPYGALKKRFINDALDLQGMQPVVPFALVLPTDCPCIEITDRMIPHEIGKHRGVYLHDIPLSAADTAHYGHIEDLITLFFNRTDDTDGNESHVLTNGLFGDLFDIIYADASDEALSRYEYLIDATEDSAFARAKAGKGYKILESTDPYRVKEEVEELAKQVMPVYVDDLHWLVSTDSKGRRFLTVFNNAGNLRTSEKGDVVNHDYDRRITITLNVPGALDIFKAARGAMDVERIDARTYRVTIPAADFAIFTY